MTNVIHFCHYIDTQGCWVLFESTNIKPLGHGANPGLKGLKMRDFGWVLLCGQRINRVSSGLCDLCASVPLGSPGTHQGHPAHGADGFGGKYWKAAAPALWCVPLLPVGKASCVRPAEHSLEHFPSTRKGDAMGRALLQEEDCKGTSMSSAPAAVDPKFHTAVSRVCIGAGCNSCFPEHSQCPVWCLWQLLLTPRQRLRLTQGVSRLLCTFWCWAGNAVRALLGVCAADLEWLNYFVMMPGSPSTAPQSNHRQLRGAYSWKPGCTSDKPWRSSRGFIPQLWCCTYLSSIFKPALRWR